MNNVSRIPEKTGIINLAANSGQALDTNGLECVIKPHGANVFVRIKETDNNFQDGFIVRDGEEFTFCGKVYVCTTQVCTVYFMKYRTL